MVVTVLDGEWSITKKAKHSKTIDSVREITDGTPFNKNNHLVSLGYNCSDKSRGYVFFNHKHLIDHDIKKSHAEIQSVLDKTTLLVGHNIKADLIWLLECGFKLPDNLRLYDTMVYEYVMAKGMKVGVGLGASCERWKIPNKKDILAEYLAKGINVDEIPIEDLLEYGEGDIDITSMLYAKQKEYLKSYEHREFVIPILKAMNEFIFVLVDMERARAKIDLDVLKQVEEEFYNEREMLKRKLEKLVAKVMGDTPVNLNSSEQLSQVVYGFKVDDKKAWLDCFNIGQEIRNGVKKKKYNTRHSPSELRAAIRVHTSPIYKTVAKHCTECNGTGKIRKVKKDGTPYKRETKCPTCMGAGYIYKDTNERAGFGLRPASYAHAIDGGFGAGGKIIDKLLMQDMSKDAKEFLESLSRYSSLTTYLDNFIGGIEYNVEDGFLHIPYNNCLTATGRLSSPFHNLPKGRTFPIKKVFTSRFKDGTILNADAASLEFRVAGILSACPEVKKAIEDKIDIHSHTRDTLTEAGEPTDRDGAKSRTFKPLYGGLSGTPAEVTWFKKFLEWFNGVDRWQKELGETAIRCKEIYSPSGRIYAFPYAKRQTNGKATNFTQICNYPVQGFGFDIIMLTMIKLWNVMKDHGIKHSKIIMNIHDSVVIDCHPDEKETVLKIFKEVVDNLPESVLEYYHLDSVDIELPWEFQVGDNWMELELVEV